MADAISCERCGHSGASGNAFCGQCGGPLPRQCAQCGNQNPAGFRFCGHCGASLDLAPAAVGPRGREERRWATVVFADLSGFTHMSELADPEDVRSLVERAAERMTKIIDDHGGWFDKLIGDCVLAVFGADVAHGDDPERAVRAALELRRCATENSADFGGLSLSIGVNTGEVMFAAVGPVERRDMTVMGDTVNTAARLQAAADPDTILVGEETWRATRTAVRYEPVEPIRTKGKEQPVAAWLALEATALDADRPVSGVPIVGRATELSTLAGIWDRVVTEQRPHLVTAVGPAGIGKTKLARALTDLIEQSGGRAARGRSLPYGESTGYGAFSLAVKHAAQVLDTGEAAEARATLRDRVRHLLPANEAEEVTANLATLVGLSAGSDADKQSLFFSARRFVEALGRETPTVLVFEDVHWADPTLLELIESLATRCRNTPVLLFTLARPELFDVAPRWGGGVPAYTALTLEALGEADARRLAALHLGVPEDSPRVAQLASVGEGNPLFIEELSASVVEQSADVSSTLPTNVRQIIAARIDALPAPERSVLLDSAVVGKVFWQGALEGLGHRDLGAALDALERRDLVRREPTSRVEGDREFTFRHILIREVAYGTLPRAIRRDRHADIARFIERAAGERTSEASSTLAHHWREAGDADRAIDYLVTAAQKGERSLGRRGSRRPLHAGVGAAAGWRCAPTPFVPARPWHAAGPIRVLRGGGAGPRRRDPPPGGPRAGRGARHERQRCRVVDGPPRGSALRGGGSGAHHG